MTYCVGLLLNDGIVMLSDSRTNAGVDSISTFGKMYVWETPGERAIVLTTAGNLSLSQTVVTLLKEGFTDEQGKTCDLNQAASMFEAASMVGAAIREVARRDGEGLKQQGVEPNLSMLLGGQIGAKPHELYMLYYAGNFIRATVDTPFLQIGEIKYGKPILDRVITPETPLVQAAKCALVSMDSTLRSNISVGLPLDLAILPRGDLKFALRKRITEQEPYFASIRGLWGEGLRKVFLTIPDPDWGV
ncbi:peptidase [Ferrovibrio terrae]|uniref:peptidase n=1 Tax=Ferrovibrio terrae TaxID=2594003 RepID=UPI003137FD28